jgi:hypothetical protein
MSIDVENRMVVAGFFFFLENLFKFHKKTVYHNLDSSAVFGGKYTLWRRLLPIAFTI